MMITDKQAHRLYKTVTSACNRLGLIKEYAHPKRTLCDYDEPSEPIDSITISRLSRTIGIGVEWVRYDKTRHGWHVIIQWKQELTPWQTVALQAIMGSDPRRESLNFFRLFHSPNTKKHLKHWNILYEYKIYRRENVKEPKSN